MCSVSLLLCQMKNEMSVARCELCAASFWVNYEFSVDFSSAHVFAWQ